VLSSTSANIVKKDKGNEYSQPPDAPPAYGERGRCTGAVADVVGVEGTISQAADHEQRVSHAPRHANMQGRRKTGAHRTIMWWFRGGSLQAIAVLSCQPFE
jgi:hypothetical protein